MEKILSALVCVTAAIALPAQTLTTLHRFDGADGSFVNAGLIQGLDGNLYGTTGGVGTGGVGTVYKITLGGTLTTVYSFCSRTGCTDGSGPQAALLLAADGNFYGTTTSGGAGGKGTVFKVTADGTLTTLYSFCALGTPSCADGALPYAGLVQASDGALYGTTLNGGAGHRCSGGCGTVFKTTPAGEFTTLHSFCAQFMEGPCADGYSPYGSLVQAANGDFYGTTGFGGVYQTRVNEGFNGGTVFKITPAGVLTTLYSFCSQKTSAICADGAWLRAGLIQAVNGEFYGTTYAGGANNGGSVFSITPSGKLTTLFSFCALIVCEVGQAPQAGLVQGTDGAFYGTTYYGGAYGSPNLGGSVFRMSLRGALNTIHSFCSLPNCADGQAPSAGLLQATNGDFYGTTSLGGIGSGFGDGTIFRLSAGLRPFVAIEPTSGIVGTAVTILGTDLTGATSVTFNGTAAAFTVNASGTAISAMAPATATTGTVQVVKPSGTLVSSVPFRVRP